MLARQQLPIGYACALPYRLEVCSLCTNHVWTHQWLPYFIWCFVTNSWKDADAIIQAFSENSTCDLSNEWCVAGSDDRMCSYQSSPPSFPSPICMEHHSVPCIIILPSLYLIKSCCCDENADGYGELKSIPQEWSMLFGLLLPDTSFVFESYESMLIGVTPIGFNRCWTLDRPPVIPLRMIM